MFQKRLGDFVFLIQAKQSQETLESKCTRTKGLRAGKHRAERPDAFTIKWLGLFKITKHT